VTAARLEVGQLSGATGRQVHLWRRGDADSEAVARAVARVGDRFGPASVLRPRLALDPGDLPERRFTYAAASMDGRGGGGAKLRPRAGRSLVAAAGGEPGCPNRGLENGSLRTYSPPPRTTGGSAAATGGDRANSRPRASRLGKPPAATLTGRSGLGSEGAP
jgi:hypothetical protein